MKLPRDLSGTDLSKALSRVGYAVTRQTGSHMRLTTAIPSQHHVTIPAHDPLKVGTLAAIRLREDAVEREASNDDLREHSTDTTGITS